MNDILVLLKDTAIQLLGGAVSTMIIGFIIGLIKKGQFSSWGKTTGKWLSKMGNARVGKNIWERFEDILTISLVSFVQGLKEGADEDDVRVEKLKAEIKSTELKNEIKLEELKSDIKIEELKKESKNT